MGDAGVEGEHGVLDFNHDGVDAEAVLGGELASGGVVEGWDGGGGVGAGWVDERRGVRGGEEEGEDSTTGR
ncbi:hypothetical protein M0R45_002942 [Rubus argutus]|uniref:Uncharacterized protein n=1 Tax=Rubus argutus TaxID=59490 RepID=A0AAW1YDK5_RUBAR